MITSTTGVGEAPSTASNFRNQMIELVSAGQKSEKILDGLRFSVFALGSSSYERFCSFGIFCDSSLETLGGQRITPLMFGDEMKGQASSFADWSKQIFLTLARTNEMTIPANVEKLWPYPKGEEIETEIESKSPYGSDIL